jgi:tetratricopeptide (TPR) repeat protein
MKRASFVSALAIAGTFSLASWGQIPAASTQQAGPKLSELLARNLAGAPAGTVSEAKREQAYAKLLEAQRYIWRSNPVRSRSGGQGAVRQAKAALQSVLELDPKLAEAYTALAELSLSSPPTDVDEAVALANLAIKVDPNNFGGHRILARLFTYKSNLNNGPNDRAFALKAIAEWKEVARLDPRNAEAWAFLSEFYGQAGMANEQIDALKKWVAAAVPIETQFYRKVMGGQSDLSPESASLKLGTALVKAGRNSEAIEVLSLLVSDEPDNSEALNLLKQSLSTADEKNSAMAIESLQQAVFANPENTALIGLLAQVQARSGRVEEGAKVLRDAVERTKALDVMSASSLQVELGDLFAGADRLEEAVTAYESALKIRGLDKPRTVPDADRIFALQVFEKLINTYKKANRPAEARAAVQRARLLLGNDVFSG